MEQHVPCVGSYKLILYFPVTALLSTISQKQQQQTNKQKNPQKTPQKTLNEKILTDLGFYNEITEPDYVMVKSRIQQDLAHRLSK